MSTVARNHHFVPQCYLKGFANPTRKGRLFVVELNQRTYFSTVPRNVAAERDFNTIDAPGHRPDAMEAALAPFEGEVAAALQRAIDSGEPPTGEDRILILNLAALLAVKNPRHRDKFRESLGEIYTAVGEVMTSSDAIFESQMRKAKAAGFVDPASTVTREQVKRITDGGMRAEVPTGFHLTLEHGAFDRVLGTFIGRRWTMLRAPRDSLGFITSDHPVGLFWSDPAMNAGPYGPGYALRGTEVMFPLSSRLAWIGTFEGDHPAVVDSSREHVEVFNDAVLHSARRQVYGCDGDCTYRPAPGGRVRRLRELLQDSRFSASAMKRRT